MEACSVVVPLYHGPREARRAVESILKQTRGDFELIVVDDDALRESREAVLAFRDPRIRLVSQPHAGAAAARNRGLAVARTEWAAFLDSDDEWTPRFLERTLAFAEAHPNVSAVFTNILGARDGRPWLELPFHEDRVLDDYFGLAIRNRGRGMTSSSSLVNARALRGVGGFPAGVARSEDVDAWLRLALAGPIACLPEVLAVYHNEDYGGRRPLPEPTYPECVRTLRRLRSQRLLPMTAERPLARLEALYLLVHARDLIDYGRHARAREILLQDCAWRHCPPVQLGKALIRSFGL